MLASLLLVSAASAQSATGTKAKPATLAAGATVSTTGASATASTQGSTAAAPAAAMPTAAPTTTPATAPAPTTTAATGAAADTQVDGATYAVRLRDLESKVDELKEQIRRSHTRLSLLSDTILSGGIGGARAEIKFKNEMSSAFRLTRALFVLDGAVQYNKQDDTGALASQTEIPIFSGSIPPGDHTLQVLIQLRGHGYGVFSYLRGYKFEVKSSHAFTITEGKTIELEATAWEKGGVTTPLEQRPAVRYLEKIRSSMGGGDTEPASPTNAQPAAAPAAAPSVSGSASISTGSK
jgi:hypothetical protein